MSLDWRLGYDCAGPMTSAIAPEVGVIIANHNNRDYVSDAIVSVARQTVRNIRVVVVDDASTDDSDKIILETLCRLDDGRFDYVRLDHNIGQAGALRRGLQALRTPFVSFLDSDDFWYENFVARHLTVHLNADYPVALTYSDSHIVDAETRLLAGTAWWFDVAQSNGSPRAIEQALIPEIDPESGCLAYNLSKAPTLYPNWSADWSSNSMAAMMFRRDFVDLVLVPPDEALRLYVDFYLSTFATLFTGAIAIPEALYAYRMHGRNKHSNGSVLGGSYNSSKRRWEPIRDSVLRLILQVLQRDSENLRIAFGDFRCDQALVQLRTALKGSLALPKSRSRLQELLFGGRDLDNC
jgi:glycosyltransferase involved in cell wall biosynthesis